MENAIDFEIPEVEKRALEDELNEFTKSKNEDNNEERRLVLSAQQAIEQPEVGQIIESVAKMNWTEANGNTYVGTGFLAKINLGEEDRLGFFTAGHNLVDESTHQVLKANSVKLRFRHIRKYTIKVNLSKLLRQTHILIVAHKKTIKIIKDGQTSIQSCRKGIDFGVVLFTSAVDSAARFLHKLGLSYLQVARPGACGSAPNMPVQLVGFPQYVENSPDSPMRILPGNELAVPEGSIPDHSYTLETQPGASGGSVFDKGGRVIAVHVKGQNLEKGDQGNWGLGFDIIRNELLQCLGGSGMALELQRTASDLNINQGMLKLTSFLRRLKLEKYIPIFEEEDIDFQVLEICKPEELEELLGKIGISLGHIKKIRMAMQEEKREEGAETIQTDGCPTQTTREKFPGIRISPVVTKSSVMADTNQTPSEIDTLYLDTDKSAPPPMSSPRPSPSYVDQVASSPSAQPKKKTSKLKQQELPIWQPVVTVRTILPYLFIIGIVFVPVGIGFIYASDQTITSSIKADGYFTNDDAFFGPESRKEYLIITFENGRWQGLKILGDANVPRGKVSFRTMNTLNSKDDITNDTPAQIQVRTVPLDPFGYSWMDASVRYDCGLDKWFISLDYGGFIDSSYFSRVDEAEAIIATNNPDHPWF